MAGRRLLVDPMLSEVGALPRDEGTGDPSPLVGLPAEPAAVLAGVQAVLVTHVHAHHFDPAPPRLMPRSLLVICPPGDLDALWEHGFEDVRPVSDALEWRGLRLVRTGGAPGASSGWVISARHEPVLYVTGDTVWSPEVDEALATHRPAVCVVNAGAAGPGGVTATMGIEDVLRTAAAAPATTLVAVHMDAVSQSALSRGELRDALAEHGLTGRVLVPDDGEAFDFGG